MTFVMRSTPLCRPRPQTPNPPKTVSAMKIPISVGDASMDVKTPLTASVGTLAKAPVRNFQKYASIHPDTVV